MGKDYYGQTPCIHPLAMAELMIRLENKRKAESPEFLTTTGLNPVARLLGFLRLLFP